MVPLLAWRRVPDQPSVAEGPAVPIAGSLFSRRSVSRYPYAGLHLGERLHVFGRRGGMTTTTTTTIPTSTTTPTTTTIPPDCTDSAQCDDDDACTQDTCAAGAFTNIPFAAFAAADCELEKLRSAP
jgi:hypothetical protein